MTPATASVGHWRRSLDRTHTPASHVADNERSDQSSSKPESKANWRRRSSPSLASPSHQCQFYTANSQACDGVVGGVWDIRERRSKSQPPTLHYDYDESDCYDSSTSDHGSDESTVDETDEDDSQPEVPLP